MDRESFLTLFNKYNLGDLFYKVVDCNKFTELENFFIYIDYDLEQVTILERGSIRGVSWYKYLHPGRCLQISLIKDEEELDEFLRRLSEDLK